MNIKGFQETIEREFASNDSLRKRFHEQVYDAAAKAEDMLDLQTAVQSLISDMAVDSVKESLYWVIEEEMDEASDHLGTSLSDFDVILAKAMVEAVKGADWHTLAGTLIDEALEAKAQEAPCCNHFSCPCGGSGVYGR